jgi:hypothetical protein
MGHDLKAIAAVQDTLVGPAARVVMIHGQIVGRRSNLRRGCRKATTANDPFVLEIALEWMGGPEIHSLCNT